MMTTETRRSPSGAVARAHRPRTPDASAAVLGRALGVTLVSGAVAAVVAAVVGGADAALGVLAGLGVAGTVFALGSFTVNAVARVLPAAALMVALLTYLLQLLVLLLVLGAVETSGALDGALDRTWLGGALIGATLVWTAAQVVLHVRQRQLAYELPEAPGHGSARSSADVADTSTGAAPERPKGDEG